MSANCSYSISIRRRKGGQSHGKDYLVIDIQAAAELPVPILRSGCLTVAQTESHRPEPTDEPEMLYRFVFVILVTGLCTNDPSQGQA